MIGALDEVITIERRTREADGAGGTRDAWAALAEDAQPFARVDLGGPAEVERAGRRIATQAATFTIRDRTDLTASDRIRWDGRIWNITGFTKPVARARYLRVQAVAGEAS
ncbi:MAG: phage head closure protein [Thioclava sp.]|nr:phage head closure protein [Thioclava sp.]MBD3803563.1 phage head closure protein [Thioclava sp.]